MTVRVITVGEGFYGTPVYYVVDDERELAGVCQLKRPDDGVLEWYEELFAAAANKVKHVHLHGQYLGLRETIHPLLWMPELHED